MLSHEADTGPRPSKLSGPGCIGMRRAQNRRRRNPIPDREMVRRAAIDRIEDIARHLWAGDTVIERAGTSLRFGAKGARVVHLEGHRKGCYADWEAQHHGDVFDFWARVALGLGSAGEDFPRVLRSLAGFLRVTETAQVQVRKRARSAPASEACSLGEAKAKADAGSIAMMMAVAEPADTSPATAYLQSRGIVGSIAGAQDLRFLQANALNPNDVGKLYAGTGATPPRWLNVPALLCLARNAEGVVTGVQRILLSADGTTRARAAVRKPSTGRLSGAALHLPVRDVTAPGPVLLAEGPETALSLWTVTGYETRALLGGFGGSYAFPKDRTLLLCHDADPADSPAAKTRATFFESLSTEGHDVRSVAPPGSGPPGWDFNDVLQASTLGASAIRDAVDDALNSAGNFSRARNTQ